MSNGWTPKDRTLPNIATIGASQTDSPISDIISLSAGGALNLVIAINVSAITVGAGVTAKLQSGINGVFVDSKTLSLTTTGYAFIKLQANLIADQAYLPLLASAKVVVTTGAGSSVTVSGVYILQEL